MVCHVIITIFGQCSVLLAHKTLLWVSQGSSGRDDDSLDRKMTKL